MEIQPYQLYTFMITIGFFILIWKIKNIYFRVACVLIMFILFTMNPLRHKQEGISSIERNVSKFNKLPDKVIVKDESFEQKQLKQMGLLKLNSEELKDEIHN